MQRVSLEIPGVYRGALRYQNVQRPSKVYLVSRTPGLPVTGSELLCGTRRGNPVLICVSTSCDECAARMQPSGGTLVEVDREDAVFLSQRMHLPLLMLVGFSGDMWRVSELRNTSAFGPSRG
jgi:hypothetical protein